MEKNKKSILVLGKQGQVAQALQGLLKSFDVTFTDHTETDFTQPTQVLKFVDDLKPEIIINTAAYTAVDKAESEPEITDIVNHKTPEALAKWAYSNKKTLVHFSSDYVFDGSGSEPRDEIAVTHPLSVYGRTKLAGDEAILRSGAKGLIIRTSWVYSHSGQNFFRTMLRLGAERDELSIVNDQIGSPTYAPDLAEVTLQLLWNSILKDQAGTQVYNICGVGYCSWYDFATEIFQLAPEFNIALKVKSLKAIPSEAYLTPAKRPLNSRLNQSKLKLDFNLEMPHWKESLKRAFKRVSQKT